jgi:hypothetical protein
MPFSSLALRPPLSGYVERGGAFCPASSNPARQILPSRISSKRHGKPSRNDDALRGAEGAVWIKRGGR